MAMGSCPLICLGTTLPALRFHASGSIRCKVHFAPAKCWGFFRWRDAGINVCFWHLADMETALVNVCFWRKSGRFFVEPHMSVNDP
jgi:hypothetical protein